MAKFNYALAILSIIFTSACSQNRKIIDVHFHARSAGDYGTPPPPNPMTGLMPNAQTNDAILKSNIGYLGRYHIVKAICSGSLVRNFDFISKKTGMFISSLEYPDHQNTPLPDTATFKKLFAAGKFSVFGELGLQYDGKTLDDPEFEPYLTICERLGIPVALHTGEAAPQTPYRGFPNFTIASGRPLLIEPVLKRHPKLKIQLMHMGYPFAEETKALMNVYPQVYADVSAIDWIIPKAEFYNYLKSFIAAGFGKRIMYGSDQMIWPDAIPLSIKNIEWAPFLNASQKEDLFYNNASAFFNIRP